MKKPNKKEPHPGNVLFWLHVHCREADSVSDLVNKAAVHFGHEEWLRKENHWIWELGWKIYEAERIYDEERQNSGSGRP